MMNPNILYAIVARDNDLAWWIPNRSLDFLVDGKTITVENTIIIADDPIDPRYETTGCPDDQRKIKRVAEKRTGNRLAWWWNLKRKYPNLRHCIFSMSVGRAARARNILLRVLGIKSWFWSYSCNMAFMCGEPETYFANLNYDHYVCWNQQQVDAMKAAGCTGEFHVTGPLFTEYAARRRTGGGGTYFFDTSFPNKYTSAEDYIAFLNDIIDYKACNYEKEVYLKLKRPLFDGQAHQVDVPYAEWHRMDEYHIDLGKYESNIRWLFYRLKKAGVRILLPSEDMDEILCKADEIIAMPYTSVVLEAIALGIPARWWNTDKTPADYVPWQQPDGIGRFRLLLEST
jgi:hypothetical protein